MPSENVQIQQDPSSLQISDASRGSTVNIQHTSREMKLYGVFEEELNALESMSSEGRFWSAVLAGTIALIAGSGWDITTSDTVVSDSSMAFMGVEILIFLVASARLFVVSIRRSVTLAGIKPDLKTPISYRTYHRLKRWIDKMCTGENPES